METSYICTEHKFCFSVPSWANIFTVDHFSNFLRRQISICIVFLLWPSAVILLWKITSYLTHVYSFWATATIYSKPIQTISWLVIFVFCCSVLLILDSGIVIILRIQCNRWTWCNKRKANQYLIIFFLFVRIIKSNPNSYLGMWNIRSPIYI